jgi:hypothetical protein
MAGKIVLTDQEVAEAQVAIARPSRKPVFSIRLFALTVFFSLVAVLFLLIPRLPDNFWNLMGPTAARARLVVGLVIFSAGWVLLIWTWWIFRGVARVARGLVTSTEVEAIADGVAVTSGERRWEFTWQYFVGYLQTEHLLVLRRPDDLFQVIPKRAFGDAAEFERIRAVIDETLSEL